MNAARDDLIVPTPAVQTREALSPGNSTAPRLRLSKVVCERGGRALFEPLSLDVPAGTLCWIRGANGAGKSTLLRALAGLIEISEGRIAWCHEAGQTQRHLRAPSLHYIGHLNAANGDLRVGEALVFLAQLHGIDSDVASRRAALSRLGLGGFERRAVRTLSQGQRRRTALARLALTVGAPVWLLDEPYDALDTDGMRALDALLAEHAQRGGCAVFASHVEPGIQVDQVRTLDPLPSGAVRTAAAAPA